MTDLGKILGLLIIGKKAAERPMFQRFLSGVAAVVALTVITGMLMGALLLGVLYGGYRLIIMQGLEPVTAALLVGLITVLLTCIFGMYTLQYLRRLVDMPRIWRSEEGGVLQRASSVVDAFLDGLLTPQSANSNVAAPAEPLRSERPFFSSLFR